MARLLGLLSPIGLRIASAVNGADAIDYVRELSNPLHLLITDLDMPKRTGWHVIDEVRKHRGPDVPIIMQTGEATYPWVKVQARKLGIVLIHKPDVDVLLVPAVHRALGLEIPAT
jgi:CheY-like chemotaxis protein